ncbi:FAD-binding oxidoreductase [Tistrella sp. BH-R2-4]|uniref:FAD-binding oxidoreductase n=1 Tax=Tistrella arctica TaxID=3133430 RepID=A0ABU9YMZ7_9PROT
MFARPPSAAELDRHLDALQGLVDTAGLLTDPADMPRYERDWMGKFHGRALGVIRPRDTAAVARVLAYLNAHRLPVVPQAGNTGLVGGSVPDAAGAFVLSVERMTRIRAVDAVGASITLDAGVVLESAQEAARRAGLMLALDLGSKGSCRIGGNISTNAGGLKVLRYGHIREQVLGLEVVLADGTVLDGLSSLRKNNTGYDLKQMFIGAEGTLGVVTAATLKLFPAEAGRAVAMVAVDRFDDALAVLAAVRRGFPGRLNSVELIGADAVALVAGTLPGARSPFALAHTYAVLIEVGSDDADAVAERGRLEEAIGALIEAGRVADAAIAQSDAQAEGLWRLREGVPEAVAHTAPVHKYDLTFAVGDIGRFIADCDLALARVAKGLRPVYFGHVADGNVHVNVMAPPGMQASGYQALQGPIDDAIFDLVAQYRGSISAEHGIGQVKRAYLDRNRSTAEIATMRALKAMLDPNGVLNPHRLLP